MRLVILHTNSDDGMWRFHLGVVVEPGVCRDSHRILYHDVRSEVRELPHYADRTSAHWFIFLRERHDILATEIARKTWGQEEAAMSLRAVAGQLREMAEWIAGSTQPQETQCE